MLYFEIHLNESKGIRTTPSIVAISKSGERLVGQIAKRQAITNPENTVFGIKRLIGRKFDSKEVQADKKKLPYKLGKAPNGDVWVILGEKSISPTEISSFDIDANGIVNVSAKDLATGKIQSIRITASRITASSGLSKQDIDRLIREADLHAGEDNMRKSLVEARNSADAAIYATEKMLKNTAGKIDSQDRTKIEAAIGRLKKAMEGENTNEIDRLTSELQEASYKVSEQLYRQTSGGDGQAGQNSGEDVIDVA